MARLQGRYGNGHAQGTGTRTGTGTGTDETIAFCTSKKTTTKKQKELLDRRVI